MEDPLIVILGIGDYHDKSQNLLGIRTDYKRCIKVFNGVYNYSVFYQDYKNKNVYKREKIDLETGKIGRRVKIEWKEAEILKFFGDARDVVAKYNHDGLIIIISSHGESGGVIRDSDSEEVSLMEIYWTFTRDECPYLKDKPKIIFVDACRGGMLCKTESTKKNGNTNTGYDNTTETQTSAIKTKSFNSSSAASAHVTDHHKSYANIAATEPPNADSTAKTNVVSEPDENTTVAGGNETKSSTNETSKNKIEKNSFENKFKKTKAYHKQGNFRFIYGSIDGYAVVEGGTKGGYLIQALCSVFSKVETVVKSNLDGIVYQINEQATERSGTSIFVPHIEDLSRMDGPVTFRIKQN